MSEVPLYPRWSVKAVLGSDSGGDVTEFVPRKAFRFIASRQVDI